jgi:hypothetical protein
MAEHDANAAEDDGGSFEIASVGAAIDASTYVGGGQPTAACGECGIEKL